MARELGTDDGARRRHRSTHTWIGTDRLFARRVVRPVARFLEIEAASGVLLIGATAIALVLANSPLKGSYASALDTEIGFEVGSFHLVLTAQEWVNDGLMAVFFFVVGLEINRELVRGELRDRKAAILPVLAALGGMVVPALVYLALNAGSDTAGGWGIPMATDIAFAVGVVSLLGNRVPPALKLFLLTLAVVDDLGAIGIIAVLYSQSIDLRWLIASIGIFVLIYLMRRAKVWYLPIYVVAGIVAWYFTLRSGVHATVAGVALGFLAPTSPLRPDLEAEAIVGRLENRPDLSAADVRAASSLINESVPVGERLVDRLHPWSSFVIVPLFALANAGIPLTAEALRSAATSTVTWGVGLGLVVGKTVGVVGMAALVIKLGLGRRPRGATGLHLLGVAMAAGVGFTVALFMSGLAFEDPGLVDEAKIGILAASVVAAGGAWGVLRLAASRAGASELEREAEENTELFARRRRSPLEEGG